LRQLGAARTGAYFATAPFVGAVLAVLWLAEPLTWQLSVAGALMLVGVWLHLTERHDHFHLHDALIHQHRHSHDEHHQHPHEPNDPPGEPHVHEHVHAPLEHTHPHYPDIHHRHRHSDG
ncbi:MAG: DMT family transporter, partial [Candidatus Competibacter sp.]